MDKTRIVRGPRDSRKQTLAQEMRRNMTLHEAILWRRLRANGLNGLHFRRQQVIDGYIVDFYCHEAGLIIEADGASHETKADYDAWRTHMIEARGLLVARFSNDRISHDLEAILNEIQQIARRHQSKSE